MNSNDVQIVLRRRVWAATLSAAARAQAVSSCTRAAPLRAVLDRMDLHGDWKLRFVALILRLGVAELFGVINIEIRDCARIAVDERIEALDPTIGESAEGLSDLADEYQLRNEGPDEDLFVALLIPLVRELEPRLAAVIQMPEIVPLLGRAILESAITARHIFLNGRS